MKHRDWQPGVWDQSTLHMLRDEHNVLFGAWRKAEARIMETLDENNRLDRELDEARSDRDNAVKNAMDRLPDAPWKDKTATEAVWLLSLSVAELTALKVRVAPHDEQRSECWRLLNEANMDLCPTMNLAHAVGECIDTLKARVAELEAEVKKLCDTLQMAGSTHATLRAELEAVKSERDTAADMVAGLDETIQALRQPVDADAWKTPLFLDAYGLGKVPKGGWNELRDHGESFALVHKDGEYLIDFLYSPADAARASLWLASYAAAHGCPLSLPAPETPEEWIGDLEPNTDDVDAVYDEDDATFSSVLYEMIKNTPHPTALERRTMMAHCGAMWRAYHKALSNRAPAPEPRPVKVRFAIDNTDKLAEQLNNTSKWTWNGMMIEEALPVFAAHAVIDVPAGVPSSYELDRIGKAAVESWNPTDEKPKMERYATAIRNAVLASQPAPHEPTAAEVEALARVLYQHSSNGLTWVQSRSNFLRIARAAFAHIPSRSNAEMQICINRKNRRIDALKACVKKWKAKAKAATPIASADTLEQLAKAAIATAPHYWTEWDCMSDTNKEKWIIMVTAILRAAKPRVDVEPGNVWIGDRPFCFTAADIDYVNSRIVYGVQLPEGNIFLEQVPGKDMTVGTCVTLLESTKKNLDRATRALVRAGFQDLGGEEWKPPIGPEPRWCHTGPTRAEAEAKFKQLFHRSGTSYAQDRNDYLDWLMPQLPDERAEVPSVEDIAKIIRGNADSIPLDAPMIARKAEALLTYLRPWLHTPTGLELDVTWQEVQAAYYRHQSGSPEGQCWHQVIELLRSRIRPTFGPCKECAEKEAVIGGLHGAIKAFESAARAALEGE